MTLVFIARALARTRTRNRTGVKNVIWRGMDKGQRVTLEEAIAILKAGW